MSRFPPNRPDHLVASLVPPADQSNRLALDAAMQAAAADTQGRTAVVVDEICRLAVGAGVSAGEVVWLVSELHIATEDHALLSEAGVAIAGMQSCLFAVTDGVQEVADRGAPIEVTSSAQALRRVSAQLAELLPRLQPV